MTLKTLNYGNYGIFLITGKAGFMSSTAVALRPGQCYLLRGPSAFEVRQSLVKKKNLIDLETASQRIGSGESGDESFGKLGVQQYGSRAKLQVGSLGYLGLL